MKRKFQTVVVCLVCLSLNGFAQEPDKLWGQSAEAKDNEKVRWFKEAKFGLFVHWGLFSQHAGIYNDKKYYGISEWVQRRGHIPATEYAKLANEFNPTQFNADEWVSIAKASGVKYIVITAKHHEGFAMYDSKVSDFDIVDATPYKKDPMKELAAACKKAGIRLGFYYSQFQDWHEPDGGGNDWDFVESKKNLKSYYQNKSIPQIKELLTNYGNLGIIWFDTPGDMTRQESVEFMKEVQRLQPNCLVSSRVGNGLGDFKDYGDGEVPAGFVKGAWEAIFTHNDSWGYSAFDNNFKTSKELIQLLATVASKGGNLMMNIGPSGNGKIPYYSEKYFKETGNWLKRNGESIYGTSYSPIKPQPWGVMTHKPGKLYLHILNKPRNGKILVPGFTAKAIGTALLSNKKMLTFSQNGNDVWVNLPIQVTGDNDIVVVLNYKGELQETHSTISETISNQFDKTELLPDFAGMKGNTKTKSLTSAHYFGDWKHNPVVYNQRKPDDVVSYRLRFTEVGDYKITLRYAADSTSENAEGTLEIASEKTVADYPFRVLLTGERDAWKPVLFIDQPIAIIKIADVGEYELRIRPSQSDKELFLLKSIVIEPVK